MKLVRSLARESQGLGGVLVPTMGALHAGHASLIAHGVRVARERGLEAGCCVSIFVNPTQFNDPKDLERYPRTLEADLKICEEAGASAVYAPDASDVYPTGAAIAVPRLPGVATQPGLEDAKRPGHFAGVCQVVKRLFDLVRPEAAVFGEKDWQQLAVVRAMVAQESMPVEIVGWPTVRDPDGLAMSSRNVFLSARERSAAVSISWALRAAGRATTVGAAERLMRGIVERAGLDVEYAVVRNGATLAPMPRTAARATRAALGGGRALIAARAGRTRLIDNAPWPGGW